MSPIYVYAQNDIAGLLDAYVRRAGIPIIGVQIVDVNDRSTWNIVYDKSATAADRARESQLIQTFNILTERNLRKQNKIFSNDLEAFIVALAPLLSLTVAELRDLVREKL